MIGGAAAAGMPGLIAGYLLRTTAVLTLALAAASAAKRRPAAVRHFILSAALIGLLVLPFLTLVPVGWRAPLLPRWMAPAAARSGPLAPAAGTEKPGVSAAFERSVEPEVGRITSPDDASPRLIAGPAAGSRGESPAGSAPPIAGPTVIPARPAGVEPPAPSKSAGRRAVDLAFGFFWTAGIAILALRLGLGLAGALRLTMEGTPLGDPSWRVLLERFLALVPLRRRVRLKSHPGVLIPLTWGWRRPTVLMPRGADGWSEEDRSSALFHELSHIKRRDFVVMLLVRASLALFWWNPLGWIVYRELLKEQELACDELVLRAGIKPSSYAASLLAFRRSAGFRWNPSAALLGMLGRSSFQERLAAILKHKLVSMEVKMRTK
ncbi:MAG TPA: M56 family metallopeptidase, partial [Acidobacteriota bacterium]|nr:M56 family metallopeptidase [Acidobacteriota bacterium]